MSLKIFLSVRIFIFAVGTLCSTGSFPVVASSAGDQGLTSRGEFSTESSSISKSKNFENAIESGLSKVKQFEFIQTIAKKMGIRVWLFGGTASGFGHYVRWDLERQNNQKKFIDELFDYQFSHIFRTSQDCDLVVDANEQQAEELERAIRNEFPHIEGDKSDWEIRLLKADRGDKKALLHSFDFLNQHTDSNSVGLIELTEPPQSESRIRDLRHWDERESPFLRSIRDGSIDFYFSDKHSETSRAKNGRNPDIFSVIRFLTKVLQFDLEINSMDRVKIGEIISRFKPESDLRTPYSAHWIEKNAKKLFHHAISLERAAEILDSFELRKILKKLGDPEKTGTLSWWMNREPLRTEPILPAGPGEKTARDLGLNIVAHETRDFQAYESITKSNLGMPNVFTSRDGIGGEAAVYGSGFYTRRGREGARGTGLTIRFKMNPDAVEGRDFKKVFSDYILILNKAAIRVIPEALVLSPFQYLILASEQAFEKSDTALLLRFKNYIRTLSETEWEAERQKIFEKLEADLKKTIDSAAQKNSSEPAIQENWKKNCESLTRFISETIDFSENYPKLREGLLDRFFLILKGLHEGSGPSWIHEQDPLFVKLMSLKSDEYLQTKYQDYFEDLAKFVNEEIDKNRISWVVYLLYFHSSLNLTSFAHKYNRTNSITFREKVERALISALLTDSLVVSILDPGALYASNLFNYHKDFFVPAVKKWPSIILNATSFPPVNEWSSDRALMISHLVATDETFWNSKNRLVIDRLIAYVRANNPSDHNWMTARLLVEESVKKSLLKFWITFARPENVAVLHQNHDRLFSGIDFKNISLADLLEVGSRMPYDDGIHRLVFTDFAVLFQHVFRKDRAGFHRFAFFLLESSNLDNLNHTWMNSVVDGQWGSSFAVSLLECLERVFSRPSSEALEPLWLRLFGHLLSKLKNSESLAQSFEWSRIQDLIDILVSKIRKTAIGDPFRLLQSDELKFVLSSLKDERYLFNQMRYQVLRALFDRFLSSDIGTHAEVYWDKFFRSEDELRGFFSYVPVEHWWRFFNVLFEEEELKKIRANDQLKYRVSWGAFRGPRIHDFPFLGIKLRRVFGELSFEERSLVARGMMASVLLHASESKEGFDRFADLYPLLRSFWISAFQNELKEKGLDGLPQDLRKELETLRALSATTVRLQYSKHFSSRFLYPEIQNFFNLRFLKRTVNWDHKKLLSRCPKILSEIKTLPL